MRSIIEVSNLTKAYNTHQAVKGISFSVKEGSLFAFLGTNGAGKSTTIEILCTLLKKSSGQVMINGFDLDQNNEGNIRKSIGVVFQQNLLDNRLTVEENILHRGKLYGLTAKELQDNYSFVTKHLQLEDIAHRDYKNLSGGQKRRADIARALIHRPKILFLDEPTTGLDPQTRQFVWKAVRQLQQDENMTVFLTTHYMEEAAVADYVVVIKLGEIVAQGTPDELKTKYAYDQLKLVFHDKAVGIEKLKQLALPFHERNDIFTIQIEHTLASLSILKLLEENIKSFEVIKGSMDDVFLHINEGAEVNAWNH
jgi:multidrug/hemolysin transport system ATP-binding protein